MLTPKRCLMPQILGEKLGTTLMQLMHGCPQVAHRPPGRPCWRGSGPSPTLHRWPRSTAFFGWSEATVATPCSWTGISCKQDGLVGLWLRDSGLLGGLAPFDHQTQSCPQLTACSTYGHMSTGELHTPEITGWGAGHTQTHGDLMLSCSHRYSF